MIKGSQIMDVCATMSTIMDKKQMLPIAENIRVVDRGHIQVLCCSCSDENGPLGTISEDRGTSVAYGVDWTQLQKMKLDDTEYTAGCGTSSYIVWDADESISIPTVKDVPCPKPMSFNHTFTCRVDVKPLIRILERGEAIIDYVRFKATPESLSFEFEDEGTEYSGKIPRDNCLCERIIEAMYPVDCLRKMLKAVKSKDVVMMFDDSAPLELMWSHGIVGYRYALAPRIPERRE